MWIKEANDKPSVRNCFLLLLPIIIYLTRVIFVSQLMYVMPLNRTTNTNLTTNATQPHTYRVFFEETSLVCRGKRMLSFTECKRRALRRLEYHNIRILNIDEEEYCYIPMGGELPDHRQRIIAFGAAAGFVHAATGYQLCRMLAAAHDVSESIGQGIRNVEQPSMIASRAYDVAMWSKQNRNQRSFQVSFCV